MNEPATRVGRRGHSPLLLAGAAIALALLAWLLACQLSADRQRTLDDSFITYVYARSLAEGHGLRFNPDDAQPTAGASSPLQVWVAAAAIGAGLEPLAATRAVALAAFLTLPFAFALAARRALGVAPGVAIASGVAALAMLALLPETRWHLATGMETIPFAVLHGWVFAWAASVAVAERLPEVGATLLGAALLLLLCVARPEGVLLGAGYVVAIALCHTLARGDRSLRRAARGIAPVALLFGAGFAGLFAWHWSYFGQPFPNAFYVKSGNAIFGSAGAKLPGGLEVAQYLAMRAGPLLAVLGAGAFWLAPTSLRIAGAILLLPGLGLTALYARAIHEAAGGFRYEYPFGIPLIAGVALLFALLARRSPKGFAAALGVALLCIPALATRPTAPVFDWLRAPLASATRWWSYRHVEDPLARMGLDLAETGLRGNATILLSGAGLVPWYSRFHAIDWIGLNDRHLSGREPMGLDEVWSYIDEQAPDVVYSFLPPATPGVAQRENDPAFHSKTVRSSLSGRGSKLFVHWDAERVAEMFHREMTYLRDHYVFGAAYALWGDWELLAYVRRDSPHRDVLTRTLRTSSRASHDLDLAPLYVNDPRTLR